MPSFLRDPAFRVMTLAALAICLIAFGLGDFRDQGYLRKLVSDRFWVQKSQGAEKFDFVVIGDSRTYRGVDPEVLSSQNGGLRGLNLGYSSGGFGPLLFDLAESRLRPDGPRIIVIGLTPHAFTPVAAANAQLKEYLSKPVGESLSMIYIDPYFTRFAPLDLKRLLRWRRLDLKEANGIEDFRPSGFVASDYRHRDPLGAIPLYTKNYSEYQASPAVEEALLERMKDWRARGFRLLAFVPPTDARLDDLERRMSGHRFEWVQERIAALGVEVVAPPLADFTSYDGSHLTPESAEKFSSLLARHFSQAF